MIARPTRNEARNGLTEGRMEVSLAGAGGRGYFFQQPTQVATMEGGVTHLSTYLLSEKRSPAVA